MATAGKTTKGAVCAALLMVAVSAPAWAAGKRVLSLGPGRGYDHGTLFQVVMTGDSMSTVRQALEADGFSFVAGESFNAAALSGSDIVFLGLFDPAEGLTSAERIALGNFVRNGGSLIYMGDNHYFSTPNQSATGLFGISFDDDASATMARVVNVPGHSVIRGAAGEVNTYDGSLNIAGFFGGIQSLGTYARAVLSTESRTVVAVIEPGALQPGSGAVVFISEANGFVDAPTGTANLGDNVTLMRNIFAFAAGAIAPCTSNDDCNDGLFCNGSETCSGGDCFGGSFPCSGGLGCHEDANNCAPCDADEQCDDGLFCNGEEFCVSGTCMPGTRPCEDSEGCKEIIRACGVCENNAQCDDFRFCNGVEVCNANGTCGPGAEVCTDACEHCDETTQDCAPCILDLDGDGFIGTGDFGFFAGCFGACYPDGHGCLTVNFDGSPDNCVGTGDFAAFSGCFGAGCETCGNCGGPDDSGQSPQTASGLTFGAEVQLVSLKAPTKLGQLSEPPTSETAFNVGDTVFVEVWASRTKPADAGLAAVYVDLHYNPALLRVTQIIPSESFVLFAKGTNQPSLGQVAALGGCAMPAETRTGLDPSWVRVASVRMLTLQSGPATLFTSSSGDTFGIAVVGEFGNLSSANVAMDGLDLTLGGGAAVAPAAPLSNQSRRPR